MYDDKSKASLPKKNLLHGIDETSVFPRYDCGILCEPEDGTGIAAALNQIAENKQLSAQMRENGLKRVQAYDWAHVALACEALYKALESHK